jgi:crotonobetainyl-CoA:carnitine CoA-transferase CaiB-like acyl-CoA transferase
MNDPQVVARETITTVDDEDLGPMKMQNVHFRMLGTPGSIRFAGRRLGQDNEQFYRESLGITSEDIAALTAKGVL